MRLPRKTFIVTGILLLTIAGTTYALKPSAEQQKSPEVQQLSLVQAPESQPSAIESTPEQQATTSTQQQTQTPAEESPPSVTNPYPEGFNIWHAFNRRTELGLTTPEGHPSDQTYWQSVQSSMTSTATLHAIAFDSGRKTVQGVVEQIHQNGTITISCTNCGAGWNTPSERTIPAASYRYLP